VVVVLATLSTRLQVVLAEVILIPVPAVVAREAEAVSTGIAIGPVVVAVQGVTLAPAEVVFHRVAPAAARLAIVVLEAEEDRVD